MKLTIFDVEHGACALIEAGNGTVGLIDCGHNSTTDWRPSTTLPRMGINVVHDLFVTNYDEDHVSDLYNLRRALQINTLWRNPTVTGQQLFNLKTESGGAGLGISDLCSMTGDYTAPITYRPDWNGITFKPYFHNYPHDFIDENNLSMAVFVDHPSIRVLFPGDLEKAGWKRMLEQPGFIADLLKTHVLVASHHGRESGCCEELFSWTGWRPQIVIVSDDVKQYQTQETLNWYRARVSGIQFHGEFRRVFTTRRDGAINLTSGLYGATIDTSDRNASEALRALRGLAG